MPGFHAPKLFMGAFAIGKSGLMQSNIVLVTAERRLVERAKKIIVLADSSKFDVPWGHVRVCSSGRRRARYGLRHFASRAQENARKLPACSSSSRVNEGRVTTFECACARTKIAAPALHTARIGCAHHMLTSRHRSKSNEWLIGIDQMVSRLHAQPIFTDQLRLTSVILSEQPRQAPANCKGEYKYAASFCVLHKNLSCPLARCIALPASPIVASYFLLVARDAPRCRRAPSRCS